MTSEPELQRLKVCEMCRGMGLIDVRTINGARGRIEVTKAGVTEFVRHVDTAVVRCRCSKGERFKDNFEEFNPHYCVSLLPGGEKIAEEVCGPIGEEYAWKPTMTHAEAIAASEEQRQEELF